MIHVWRCRACGRLWEEDPGIDRDWHAIRDANYCEPHHGQRCEGEVVGLEERRGEPSQGEGRPSEAPTRVVPVCLAGDSGYLCTLDHFHTGDHIAGGSEGNVCHRWPSVRPEPGGGKG